MDSCKKARRFDMNACFATERPGDYSSDILEYKLLAIVRLANKELNVSDRIRIYDPNYSELRS